jgi:exo-1,4-beta-D-glucosaminidase
VGTLVEDSVYRNPFFGMNLRDLPGMTYPIGRNFVRIAMDSQSPFAVPWWYRNLPAARGDTTGASRCIDGINYRANIWLNGRRLRLGAVWRRSAHELDATDAVRSSELERRRQVFALPPDS